MEAVDESRRSETSGVVRIILHTTTAYTESQERFTKMFEDKAKYDVIMNVVATPLFREFRNTKK